MLSIYVILKPSINVIMSTEKKRLVKYNVCYVLTVTVLG